MMKWIATIIAAFVAITFACTSDREIPRAVLETEYAAPPSQFVTLNDGARVHFRDRGPRDAPVLILLHGFSGSLFVWEKWSVALSQPADRQRAYRVIALDLPGNGLTGAVPSGDYSQAAMTELLKRFADKLGLQRFALAGNSMGGAVAARFAERYPARVTHLILIDAAGAQTSTRPRLHAAWWAASTPLIDRWFLHLLLGQLNELSRMQGTPQTLLARFRLPDDDYVWQHVTAIKAPTLILWGEADHTIPVASAYAWQKAIPGAKLVIYPHAGHVSMVDAPQSVEDVRVFLARDVKDPNVVPSR